MKLLLILILLFLSMASCAVVDEPVEVEYVPRYRVYYYYHTAPYPRHHVHYYHRYHHVPTRGHRR